MIENKTIQKEEFQQAKVLAISKTARSIKSIHSIVLLIFIIAVVIAAVMIGMELFTEGAVSVNSQKKPPLNEIIHTAMVGKNEPLNLTSDRLNLQDRMISEEQDVVALNPIDDVVKHEDTVGGYDTKPVDPKILDKFQSLMNEGVKEFSDYNYPKALEIFDEARKYKDVWYSEIKRANEYYDMTTCLIDIKKGVEPFLQQYKLVKLIPSESIQGEAVEGFVKKDVDLQEKINSDGKVYLNYLHKTDGKIYTLSKDWSFEILPEDKVGEALMQYFRVSEKTIDTKIKLGRINPMDYVEGLIKLAFEVGDIEGFESKTIAHDYFLDAFELDRYLFETINLHKDKRYFDWLTLIENNNMTKAVTLRKSLQLSYPNAWEFREDDPEIAIVEKIKLESEGDDFNSYDPSIDPEVVRRRSNLANKSIKEKIRFFAEYGNEAELKGDKIWEEVLASKADQEELEYIIRNAMDQWKLAKYWYKESQKLTTDEIDSQNLEDKKVKMNQKIYWAKKRLH